ncbi:hypothetical protein J437_LFUL008491 [Ladona fulva]|uniref:Sodium-dependent serotonin transporter n=1 Tax=Ladona fulva TaxID=123851 RepID=A0A8K0NZM7_LADFU|nr:hypothetical protein J437_LFUL008491 [Ladona fulva]
MGMYYNTIIGWAVYYLFTSFRSELPWTSCNNSWNTPNCVPIILDEPAPVAAAMEAGMSAAAAAVTATSVFSSEEEMRAFGDVVLESLGERDLGSRTDMNFSIGIIYGNNQSFDSLESVTRSSPAKEFFEGKRIYGLDRMGPIKGSLTLCVFAVFLLVYFSLWKGVRSTGKAVWFTALAPYVVLFILLARGVTLPGADVGIRYYLTPQWNKLTQSKVWIDAASQIFFSLGPGFGTLLALSSYNKFNNNCYRDAILTSSINCLTSFLAGFVIFSVLGYMAHVQKKSIEKVGLEGPGLVFIVYPEAIATMTGSVFWSIIFFLMLITLGLDSTFGGLEAMITGLCDEYPRLLGRHREIFVGCLLLMIYICGLPTTTYVSTLFLSSDLPFPGNHADIFNRVRKQRKRCFWLILCGKARKEDYLSTWLFVPTSFSNFSSEIFALEIGFDSILLENGRLRISDKYEYYG